MPEIEVVTSGEHPDLKRRAAAALRAGWPEFVLHDPVTAAHRKAVASAFGHFDVLLLDGGEVVAHAVAVALRWSGDPAELPEGYDGALIASVREHAAGVEPDTLCLVSATVRPDRSGSGLASAAVSALRERAVGAGLRRVVVPVRPPLKAQHPLTPMAEFAGWTRADGLHPDPWIRTHQRLGAAVIGPAPRSMVVTGTVAQWERWTGTAFPRTGRHLVPGALDPVEIDRERDRGTYEETNLWMRHR